MAPNDLFLTLTIFFIIYSWCIQNVGMFCIWIDVYRNNRYPRILYINLLHWKSKKSIKTIWSYIFIYCSQEIHTSQVQYINRYQHIFYWMNFNFFFVVVHCWQFCIHKLSLKKLSFKVMAWCHHIYQCTQCYMRLIRTYSAFFINLGISFIYYMKKSILCIRLRNVLSKNAIRFGYT